MAEKFDFTNYFKEYPDENGFFGPYGGAYIEPELKAAMDEINEAYFTICKSSKFIAELREIRKNFQGRPTPITYCENLSRSIGDVQIYVKREDLNHSGAHKLNHCMGEALLAKYMGKKKVIAETGAGQHGVALATAAAHFGLECDIYMGSVDIKKQAPNVARMKILGANVIEVTDGLQTLKEAVDAAFAAYAKEYKDCIYCIGSVLGPHPFPMMVRDFQSVVGLEAHDQFLEMTGELPDSVVACVGGGSNAAGTIYHYLNDERVKIILGEAGGMGVDTDKTAASMQVGTMGILHGSRIRLMQTEDGQIIEPYSISAGLDYPGTGPMHCNLYDQKRAQVLPANDDEALRAAFELTRMEGIIPALESAHALALLPKVAPQFKKDDVVVLTVSGRGDKDLDTYLSHANEM